MQSVQWEPNSMQKNRWKKGRTDRYGESNNLKFRESVYQQYKSNVFFHGTYLKLKTVRILNLKLT